uniref:Peptidyl-prolyl cis-trans isomerase n=2 Tax=Choreotrichia TaxID=141411 RepID=A0A7S3MKT5_9SPIT|mmetsp:Transcript_16116/g.20472  ORF Transcript_16116/g.20472 Transcript_16116/m.20472 type:complete len:183 (+) Transcript_16116:53-601(+)|eukprot:CAMPEP_0170462764 /NCGR_PEP_ID=MMETSP0123-20130129/8140_1 /TAXON_ID=182087 /ORGANISM="Favella ehrenbergii, Strain Fehren 1" /LENGTH=182 /DNA_ID=CAMNT_0010728051 /DNA_START=17 /DNA_END=565 /DNA_ORIENTATION=-
MNTRQLFNINKRGFASLYNYSSAANPRVYLTVAKGDKRLGDLVFELYAEQAPATSESFRTLCAGSEGQSFAGTSFHQGMSGFGISGGRMGEENVGAFGVRLQDEDLSLRHHKRGQLTLPNDGENTGGSEFTITFGEASYLDGYQTVFGELVDGQRVLDALEAGVDRHGSVSEDFKIVASGQK